MKRKIDENYHVIIRTMIENESSNLSARMNWFLVSEGLLVAAFSQMSDMFIGYNILVAAVGIIIAATARVSFRLSEVAIEFILSQWDKYRITYHLELSDFPPVWAGSKKVLIPMLLRKKKTGMRMRKLRKAGYNLFDMYKSLPVIFFFMWLSLTFMVCVFN